MQIHRLGLALLGFFLCTQTLSAELAECQEQEIIPADFEADLECECECECEKCCTNGNILTIGPEFSYLKRKRKGGTEQSGMIYGVRATYDRLKRYGYYLGAQAYYGTGIITGHNSIGSKLKSQWTDAQIEGNVGYTFQYKYFPFVSLTPFIGGGYFHETNKFKSPSPLPLKFITTFPYLSYGFLSKLNVTSFLSIGLNGRFRSIWEAKCRVKDDPDFEKIKLQVGHSFHYRIEIPFVYCRPLLWNLIELGAVPFFELRSYGGRENFPFDFFKTTVRLYGVNVQIIFRF